MPPIVVNAADLSWAMSMAVCVAAVFSSYDDGAAFGQPPMFPYPQGPLGSRRLGALEYNNAMEGFVRSIEKAAQQNKTFRTVLYTAKNCQLVVMSLKPGEDIGAEVHKLDQFVRVEEGEGKAVLDGIEHRIKSRFALEKATLRYREGSLFLRSQSCPVTPDAGVCRVVGLQFGLKTLFHLDLSCASAWQTDTGQLALKHCPRQSAPQWLRGAPVVDSSVSC